MNLIKEIKNGVIDLLDNDEISPEEAAFMVGYFDE